MAGILITDAAGNVIGVKPDYTPPPQTLTLDTSNQVPIVNTVSNGPQVSNTASGPSVGGSTVLSALETSALDVVAHPFHHLFFLLIVAVVLWFIWKHHRR